MENNIINMAMEREKRETRRKNLIMPTKDLMDYLKSRQTFRDSQRIRARIKRIQPELLEYLHGGI